MLRRRGKELEILNCCMGVFFNPALCRLFLLKGSVGGRLIAPFGGRRFYFAWERTRFLVFVLFFRKLISLWRVGWDLSFHSTLSLLELVLAKCIQYIPLQTCIYLYNTT
jgi:hypothetical protein